MWLCCGGDKINDAVVNECMSNKKNAPNVLLSGAFLCLDYLMQFP